MSAMWAIREAKNMKLGDARRNIRAAKILETMAESPTASIPHANDSWANTKATYRFVETTDFDAQDILEGHYRATQKRIIDAGEDVIITSDGMDISLPSLKETSGLGPLSKTFTRGIKTHNTLVFNKEFIPLGLIDIKYWVRDPKDHGRAKSRKTKKIEEKETFAWIEALRKTEIILPKNIGYTFLGDGSADIYDVFAEPRRSNSELLIHLIQNRNIKSAEEQSEEKFFDALDNVKSLGLVTINLPRTHKKAARQATLEIRVKTVEIKPPVSRKKENLPTIQVTAILAREIRKDKLKTTNKKTCKSELIVWRLLTSSVITTLEEAIARINLYTKRWLIERYHYILKEGCGIEKLQMESADNLQRATALYSIVAWRLMYITYAARNDPDAPCTIILSKNEWQSLWCYVNKKQHPPDSPPTIKAVVLLLAKLGGFLARKGDGEPGAKVIWRGLMALEHITEMFTIFKGKNVGNG